MYEVLLISKILNDKDFSNVYRYNISNKDFYTCGSIYDYVEYNYKKFNCMPSIATVEQEFNQFKFTEEVSDSYKFLCYKLKEIRAKRSLYDLIDKKINDKFNNLTPFDFMEYMLNEINTINYDTDINYNFLDYANDYEDRIDNYKNTKINKESINIPSPFETLNKLVTFSKGDYFLFNAFTNKGKSWVISLFGLNAYLKGFNVLYYSPEMTAIQQAYRFDTLLTNINNQNIKQGLLSTEEELKYINSISKLTNNENKLIIKTCEHLSDGLNIDTINKDLESNKYDIVVIDGFNLMSHKRLDNTRNTLSNTSRELRRIFIKYNVLGIVVHQVSRKDEQYNNMIDSDGERLISPPELHQFSESISLIQDPTIIITFDRIDYMGQLKIVKAKEPIEEDNNTIDLFVDYNVGVIKER
jgi:replicative DNA helicase